MTRGPKPRPAIERLLPRVDHVDDCWVWRGYLGPAGYGQVGDGGSRVRLTHHVTYEHFVGPIPQGLELDHLCRNRACCNPAHLEPVTRAENNRRAGASKTHCIKGHPYTSKNVKTHVRPDGRTSRECRECDRARHRSVRNAGVAA